MPRPQFLLPSVPAGQEVHFRHSEQEISLNDKKAKPGRFPIRAAACKRSCFPLSTKRARQPCWQCPRSCGTEDHVQTEQNRQGAKNQAWGHRAASRKQNAKAWVPFPCQCCWVPSTLLLLRANIALYRGSPRLWQGQSGRNLPAPAVTRGAGFVLQPCLSHCELHPEAMQIWDGGVSGAPDSSGHAQPS